MARAIRIVSAPTRKGKTVFASVLAEFGESSDAAAIGRFTQLWAGQHGHTILAEPTVNDITAKARDFVRNVR